MTAKKPNTRKRTSRKRVAPEVEAATERARDEDGQFKADDQSTPNKNEAYKVRMVVVGPSARRYQAMDKPELKTAYGSYTGKKDKDGKVIFEVEPEVATKLTANPNGPFQIDAGGDA